MNEVHFKIAFAIIWVVYFAIRAPHEISTNSIKEKKCWERAQGTNDYLHPPDRHGHSSLAVDIIALPAIL